MDSSASALALLLMQVVLILGVSRGVHWVVGKRVGQPFVVSEIAAGVLLGPSVFGALAPEMAAAVFAPSSLPTLTVVSDFGVVLFTFLVGLEIDPALLRTRARVPIVVGCANAIAPAVLGVGAGVVLHSEHGGDSPVALFAVFVGVALSISAFPVLARILSEHRVLSSTLGAIAMSAAAVTSLIVWCALALVVAATRFEEAWRGALVTVAAAIGLGLAFHAIRPLFVRLDARPSDTAHDSTVVVAVMLTFSAVAAAERLGLHGLLVAFVAGLLVPRSAATDALVERLESLVVLVLLPLFFASSGLHTDLRLFAGDGLVLAALVGLSVVGKVGGVSVAARAVGVSWRDALRLGVLLDARGLFGLIVVNVGLQIGVLSPRLFSMLVVTTWLTTVLVAPALKLLDRGEPRATRSRASLPATTSGGVLVHLDDPRALRGYEDLFRALAKGNSSLRRFAALHLRPPREAPSVRHAPERTSITTSFDELLGRLGLEGRAISYVSSRPAEDLVRTAETKDVSLILLAARRPFFEPLAGSLGGLAWDVLHQTERTVAVLTQADSLETLGSVLIPYAGTADERDALRLGAALASGGIPARLLRVPARPGEALGPIPSTWPGTVEQGEGASAIASLLEAVEREPPDLIVIGFAKVWGVTTNQRSTALFSRIHVPMLIVGTNPGST